MSSTGDSEKPPRVFFSDFLEMMKRFEAERIGFAFPSQTVYLRRQQ